MKKRTIRAITGLGVTTLALGLCTAAALPGQAETAAPVQAQASTTVQKMANGAAITTLTAANGDETSVYDSQGPVIITPNALTSTVDASGETEYSSGASTSYAPAVYTLRSIPTAPVASVHDMLTALGADPATVAYMDAITAPAPVTGPVLGGPLAKAKNPRASSCQGQFADHRKVHFYGCWLQYLTWKNSAGDWHLLDNFYSSVTIHDGTGTFSDKITGLLQGLAYGKKGNEINQWIPKQTTQEKCSSTNITIGYDGTSASDTFNACSEQSGLYYGGTQHFQTKWDGKGDGPKEAARDTAGLDSMNNPPLASPTRSTNYTYWWK